MKKRKWKWILISLLIVLIGLGSALTYYLYSVAADIHTSKENSRFKDLYQDDEVQQYEPEVWEGTERVNILLLGGDSRGIENGEPPRSDTMIVVSVDPVSKQVHLLSILRDTWVDIPGHGQSRINSAFATGGPYLAQKAVSEWLGIPIQYHIFVDFEGFIALVDAVGGIDYYVEKDMYYSSRADGPAYTINLKEGYQHLDGQKALQYVRFRHDAMSDYARTERQRNFLTAIADKVQSTSSIMKFPSILNNVKKHIETNITPNNLLKLGNLAFDVRTSQVASLQLPPFELLQEVSIGGASVLTADQAQLQQFIQESFAKQPEPEQPAPTDAEGTHSSSGADGQTGESSSSLTEPASDSAS
ncbi:LCP family protein [Marinicrinis sediminis]|uniref:LCP family protein n=1 Tax=Marinicrinis sediminis TaxID=1652465 RepID=A0ABW5REN5_9BACL